MHTGQFSQHNQYSSTDFMESLEPVNLLNQDSRERLLKKARYENLGIGSKIRPEDELHWLIYVLDGYVEEKGNAQASPAKKTNGASSPLFSESTHIPAVAKSETVIVRFDRQLFETLLDDETSSNCEVSTIDVSDNEIKVFGQFIEDYQNNNIDLPGLPHIALRIREAATDPNSQLENVTEIIKSEPALSEKLIHQANHGSFNLSDRIHTLNEAVSRLGSQTVQHLVNAHAIANIFKETKTTAAKRLKRLYKESVNIASIAYLLAEKKTSLNPAYALLSGMVHGIGFIPLLAHTDQESIEIDSESELELVLKHLHPLVGGMVLRKWCFDDELIAVTEESHNWYRTTNKAVDYCDIIIASRWCVRMLSKQDKSNLPTIMDVPVLEKLNMTQAGINGIKILINNAKDEFYSIRDML